jgi:Asp-tRNA(Asn)/Glu-tRNA(Gln) amidotransferase A subunit family amidase
MKGLDLNAGFVGWVGNTADTDAVILQLLWNAGAVFHARTTEPQSLMHLETSSNLYGVTVNPFNRKLTCGGSSGGEGALIGMKGSCLGIGTDIGGSIRSPCANNGLFGLKPTTKRLPNLGCHATMLSEEHIVPTIGPMSTSLEGVKIFMKTLVDQKPWLHQSALLPFPWRINEDLLPKTPDGKPKLKVAVLWDDGIVRPHAPITRALKQVTDALKTASDVEVVDWQPHNHAAAWPILASLYFADGGAEERAALELSGEPVRPLTDFILTDNQYRVDHSIASLWEWTGKRDAYRDEYMHHWNSTATGPNGEGEVDVILCPVGPGAAPPLDCARYWGYTSQWNLLDYPAAVFPVSAIDPETDVKVEGYEPRNEEDRYNWELCEYCIIGWERNANKSLQ